MDRFLNRAIRWALTRWTSIDVRDYISLLKLSGEYGVMEMQVREGDWVAGKCLRDCRLSEEGITVLGIYRADGSYVGSPRGPNEIHADDVLILYGRDEDLRDLDTRGHGRVGDRAHHEAVHEHEDVLGDQDEPSRQDRPTPESES